MLTHHSLSGWKFSKWRYQIGNRKWKMFYRTRRWFRGGGERWNVKVMFHKFLSIYSSQTAYHLCVLFIKQTPSEFCCVQNAEILYRPIDVYNEAQFNVITWSIKICANICSIRFISTLVLLCRWRKVWSEKKIFP